MLGCLVLVALTALGVAGAPRPAAAQTVSAAERESLARLRTERGGRADEIDGLLKRVDEAAGRGLPTAPLTGKIREGLAKGHDPRRIDPVIQQMAGHLETADRLLRELGEASGGQNAAVTLLAESLGSGVTSDEVREILRGAQGSAAPPSAAGVVTGDRLSGAAKGYSFIKDARLPPADGTAVMAEAVRQGFRSHEMLDLGRSVKIRESDYRSGRASLTALRDAIARGDRPEQLFRDVRPETPTRPAATRPERVERPERPEPTPQRPERPTRPERPGASIR